WHWDFAKPMASRGTAKKGAPLRTTSFPPPVVGGYGAAATPITAQTVAQQKPRRRYRGAQRVDLDLKDVDLHNLVRALAGTENINVVIPDNVKATVTVRLFSVPWEQALEVILKSKGLGYVW